MAHAVLGLDVGGANLKAAHTSGMALSRPFALWKNPGGLANALRALIQAFPRFDILAVTMTGELCDCFETKRQGVAAILDAVQAVARAAPVRVWQTTGCFVDSGAAQAAPLQTASANWHALATWAGRHAPKGLALLLDIGSTTTDIIPLMNGRPEPRGRTDTERLRSGELVYIGVRRTPLCAVLGGEGAAEFFATTHDLFLFLGSVPEDAADCDTADGRPATRAAAHARLARMMCADSETMSREETTRLAHRALAKLAFRITMPLESICAKMLQPPQTLIGSGSGEFLIPVLLSDQKELKQVPLISLAKLQGPAISQAACAHAVAVLAAEGREN